MLVAAIVVALGVGAFISFFVPKKYSSTVDFYVINTNTSYDYTTQALLSASEYLIRDYVKLIKSDEVLEAIAEEINKDLPENEQIKIKDLRSMISASTEEGTSVFTIKVTHTDPEFAARVANEIMLKAPKAVTKIAKPDRLTNEYLVNVAWQSMINREKDYLKSQSADSSVAITDAAAKESIMVRYGDNVEAEIKSFLGEVGLNGSLNCFEAVNRPVVDTSADSPSVLKYAFVGAVFAMVFVYLVFFAQGLLKANLVSEEDIKQFVDKPVIGIIPHWESTPKSNKK